MESPVVVDKPPEYHGNATNERGFPFDEEEGSGAWSSLAARHPDIAARLRQRPATWARKRRPSSQDGIDDTNDFEGFDRFPFDDIPPEFREHFPSHWNRRFGSREEQYQPPPSPQPHSPQQNTAATQTEQDAEPSQEEQTPLPQYGLRNTVDLGQKSQPDPSVVDAEERSHRSMSAPPDQRPVNQNTNKMSNHQEQPHQPEQQSNVRHIPIFVEGRDEPVINKNVDHGTHFAETKPAYVPPPQPHIDREQYFADDGPAGFPFTKSFERPFFRQAPQPFSKQKMYPQAAFNRGGSPQRSQSPKPQPYHEPPRPETPSRSQQKPPPQHKQPSPQQRQPPPQQAQQPPQARAQTPPQAPPPQPQPSANDPITLILSIQTDVLNLMTEVENFTGTKKDKRYLFLDEMLTRNLIKLDNIETDGKENIRQARKEAIKCIQKCIAVLEAKADSKATTTPQSQDVEMQNPETNSAAPEQAIVQNGDVEMKDTKEEEKTETLPEQAQPAPEPATAPAPEEEAKKEKAKSVENKEAEQPPIADTRPEEDKAPEANSELKPDPQKAEETTEKKTPKKVVKKRDKSKDKKEVSNETKKEVVEKKEESKDCKEEKKDLDKAVANDINESVNKDEVKDKQEILDNKEKINVMQIVANAKGEVKEAQAMEVDAAASQ